MNSSTRDLNHNRSSITTIRTGRAGARCAGARSLAPPRPPAPICGVSRSSSAMPADPPLGAGGDGFAGWLVFSRCGGGYVAVREVTLGRYVQAPTLVELAAAVALADTVRVWADVGNAR